MVTRANGAWVLAALILCCAVLLGAAPTPTTSPSQGGPVFIDRPSANNATADNRAAVVMLNGEIDDFVRDSIYRGVTEARADGAHTVILEINTYGGLLTSGLDISRFLKRQNDLHIIAFVHDKAISAGALVAMACDEVVTDPSGVLGDCAPIVFNTDGTLHDMAPTERAKAESPVLADFRDSAERNGYDPRLTEAMVVIGHPLYCVVDSHDNRKIADEKEKDDLLAKGWKLAPNLPSPLNDPDKLLTLHDKELLDVGIARGIYDDVDSIAAARGLRIVATLTPGWGETIVQFLSSGIVRGILIAVFMLALQVSLSAPGHGAAEATAVVALGILLGVPLMTGYAIWWEVMLILIGLALVAFEIFVFPGHMVSLIVGSMMVIFGLVLTFAGHDPGAPPWMPETQAGWTALRDGLICVVSAMLASVLLWMWLSRYLPTLPYFNRLVLTATTGGPPRPPSELGGPVGPVVGAGGRAVSDLRPGGLAEFADGPAGDRRVVSAVAESGFIPAGSQLVVRESRGSYVIVRAVSSAVVPTETAADRAAPGAARHA
jgi:membrane-bound serine protease (ClpP class)